MKITQAEKRDQIELNLPAQIRFDTITNADGVSLPQQQHLLDHFDPFKLILKAGTAIE